MQVPPDSNTKVEFQIRSSSVISDESGTEKLREYMNWWAKRVPNLAEKFMAAEDVLIEKDYTFEDLKRLSDESFDRMNISEGVGSKIRNYTAKFLKSKVKGRG